MRWALAAVMLLGFVGSASAASSAGLEGVVHGLPSSGERQSTTFYAVHVTDGRIVAVQAPRSGSRYRLRVSPGLFLVVAEATGANGRTFGAISRLVVARAGRTTRRDLRASAIDARAATRALARPRAARSSGGAAAAPVVAIGDVRAGSYPVDSYVIGQVFPPLEQNRMRLVDQTGDVRSAIHHEEIISANGRTQTRFTYRPLKPEYSIVGDSRLNGDGTATFELDLVDLATGAKLVQASSTGPLDPRYGWGVLVAQATGQLRNDLVGAIRNAESGGGGTTGGERVPVSLRLRVNCACGPGSAGTVTATPPGSIARENDDSVYSNASLAAGTSVVLEARAAPGYYLGGFGGTCRFQEKGKAAPQLIRFAGVRSATCTIVPIVDPTVNSYAIVATADFHPCPEDPATLNPSLFPFAREDCG